MWTGGSVGGNSHGCHAPSILAGWFVEPDNPPCYLACSDAGCVSPRGLRVAVSLAGLADARLGRPLAPDAQAYLSDRFLLAGCWAGEDALSLRPAVAGEISFFKSRTFRTGATGLCGMLAMTQSRMAKPTGTTLDPHALDLRCTCPAGWAHRLSRTDGIDCNISSSSWDLSASGTWNFLTKCGEVPARVPK